MFDSYIVSNTKTSLSMPLACPPRKLKRSKGFRRFAFTLAETLITLTIIGVIAALTVPNLLNKYTKHTYVVGLKKAYAQLQHAMKMIPITEGCSAGDYDCAGMFEEYGSVTNIDGMDFRGDPYRKKLHILSKQFKTSKIILDASNNEKICFVMRDITNLYYNPNCFETQDGTIITATFGIGIDINGTKGPNKKGRDQFLFDIAEENKNGIHQGTLLARGSKASVEYYAGESRGQYWKETCNVTEGYNGKTTNINEYCTGRVLEEDAMNY